MIALALTLVFSLRPAGAQSGDSPFKGQTITVIAASSPGGGTDSLARLLARHFSKFIPGNPKIVVTNMAGAAGLIAANHLYNRSPKDGTAIGTMATGLTFRTAQRDPAIKFQLEKFTYLGQIASEGNFVYVRSDTPFTSIEAIKKGQQGGQEAQVRRPGEGAQFQRCSQGHGGDLRHRRRRCLRLSRNGGNTARYRTGRSRWTCPGPRISLCYQEQLGGKELYQDLGRHLGNARFPPAERADP